MNILQAWVYVVLRPLRIIKSYIPDLGNLRAFSLEVDPELRPPPLFLLPLFPQIKSLRMSLVTPQDGRASRGAWSCAPRHRGFGRCPQQTAIPVPSKVWHTSARLRWAESGVKIAREPQSSPSVRDADKLPYVRIRACRAVASEQRRAAIRHDVPQIQQLFLGQRVWKRRRRGSVEDPKSMPSSSGFLPEKGGEKIFRLKWPIKNSFPGASVQPFKSHHFPPLKSLINISYLDSHSFL